VIYFYPKDDTPGCTTEACSFRDSYADFKKAGVILIGISPDSEKSHTKFIDKYELPFPLLSDTDHKVCEAYGVWGLKNTWDVNMKACTGRHLSSDRKVKSRTSLRMSNPPITARKYWRKSINNPHPN